MLTSDSSPCRSVSWNLSASSSDSISSPSGEFCHFCLFRCALKRLHWQGFSRHLQHLAQHPCAPGRTTKTKWHMSEQFIRTKKIPTYSTFGLTPSSGSEAKPTPVRYGLKLVRRITPQNRMPHDRRPAPCSPRRCAKLKLECANEVALDLFFFPRSRSSIIVKRKRDVLDRRRPACLLCQPPRVQIQAWS